MPALGAGDSGFESRFPDRVARIATVHTCCWEQCSEIFFLSDLGLLSIGSVTISGYAKSLKIKIPSHCDICGVCGVYLSLVGGGRGLLGVGVNDMLTA